MSQEIGPREVCSNCIKLKGDTSRNNLAVYSNGKFCMSCGYIETINKKYSMDLITGTISDLPLRGINKDTCEKYNVRVKLFTGKLSKNGQELSNEFITIFPIYSQGKLVKQKLKCQNNKKEQGQTGDSSCMSLFGMNRYNPTKLLPVIVTEGEEDTLSMYQMLPTLPVVSITRGATGAFKELSENMVWLSGWKEVLLCFDNDDVGQEAISKCLPLFEPGFCKVVKFPLKDANEMLLAGRQEEIRKYIQTAEVIKPNTIIFPSEIKNEILKQAEWGNKWPWEFMNKVTYGNRRSELYMLAADTSIGKTQFVYEIVTNHLNNKHKIALIDLERGNAQTMQRIISARINKRIYLPDCNDFDKEEISKELEKIGDNIALYRPESGKLSIDSICINIRYLAKGHKIDFFIVDNLTALAVDVPTGSTEHGYLSLITGKLVQLTKELNITIFLINHVVKGTVQMQADITWKDEFDTNKKGLNWESGRIPTKDDICGGKNVAALPDYLIVLARNRMSKDDIEHRTIRVKFIKTRFESSYEGHEFKVIYDYSTGRLLEVN